MTSFGWKRKAPGLSKQSSKTQAFDESEQVTDEGDDNTKDPDFDWITLAKKKKLEALEDNKTLFARLKQEGIVLAEQERFWQAINRWDNALALDPSGTPQLPTLPCVLFTLVEKW